MKKISLLCCMLLVLVGCSSKDKKINIDKKPIMQVPKVFEPVQRNKGTLYSKKGASLFSDKKDLQVGDIIQILIEETLTNDSSASRTTTKANSTSLGGGLFAPATGVTSTLNTANKLNSATGLGFSSASTNSFKGTTKSDADEEFTTTISAIIEQTYQNGNYFIKGTKEMLINDQKQNIKISGVIRPYDISPDNTVYSYQLANLKILYEKDGEEIDALSKPWGTKILETIWPF
ncbi:MAG: flagellar basal body L-ring protein FlgH [Campylobacterota bacterium]|nr:flagellar basal body L-ring protein FlgH [Campylobacterota bacterium]